MKPAKTASSRSVIGTASDRHFDERRQYDADIKMTAHGSEQDMDKLPKPAGLPRSGFGQLTVTLSIVGTLLIVVMCVLVNADILGRGLFNHPVSGVTEFLGLSIVSVVFLQMANTAREDRHISNDLIMSAVSKRRPRAAMFFYGLFQLIAAILFLLVVWFVVPIFLENYRGNYYKGTAGYIEIPVWPFVGTVVLGAAAAAVQHLLLAVREFRRTVAEPNDV
jgi:TRAP-type C4-dicarboxylate transport system permease small subunit